MGAPGPRLEQAGRQAVALHLVHPGGNGHNHPRPPQNALAHRLGHEIAQHGAGHFKIGDHAVAQGPHRHDISRRASHHATGLLAYGEHIARFPVNGDDRGLVEHHALPLAIDHDAGRAQINANIQNRCHETKSPLCGIDS